MCGNWITVGDALPGLTVVVDDDLFHDEVLVRRSAGFGDNLHEIVAKLN